jgi:hypothetical protein
VLSEVAQRPPYLPFLDGAPDFLPNLKPISGDKWLLPDTEADAWLASKHTLMLHAPEKVSGGEMDSAPAQELQDLVQGHVPRLLENGWPNALMSAASLVSDDLIILDSDRPNDWRLMAGVLCAPTFWTLPERVGLDLGGLHGPVPGGDPELAGRIGRVFSGLQPGIVLERFNWTVQVTGERFTPERPNPAGCTIGDLYLRVERQTIRKLEETGAVVFTIRVCLDPLLPILRDPGVREAFEDAWLGAKRPVRAYKAWQELEPLIGAACREAA